MLNNIVIITTLGAFTLVPGPRVPEPLTLTSAQQLLLGVGTTLGVVVMTAALLPSLHASGFRWRLRWDFRGMGLGEIGRLAGWTVLYVAAGHLGLLVLTRLATDVGQLPQYATALIIWQLPFAVVASSIISALLPRMSRHAVGGRPDLLRRDLDRGLRLTAVMLIPAAFVLVVLGRQVAVTLFAHGVMTYGKAEQIGVVLGILALGLLPFSSYQLQSRVFYAMGDTRTPALIQVLVSTVLIMVDVGASTILPDGSRMYGLAAGVVLANGVGAVAATVLVRRRLGRSAGDPDTRRSLTGGLTRMLGAGLAGAAAAAGVAMALGPAVSEDWMGAGLVLAVASVADLLVYAGALTLLRADEARAAIATLRQAWATAASRR